MGPTGLVMLTLAGLFGCVKEIIYRVGEVIGDEKNQVSNYVARKGSIKNNMFYAIHVMKKQKTM